MSEKARKPPSDDAPEIILPPAPVVGERMPLRHTLTGSGQTCSACKHFRQEGALATSTRQCYFLCRTVT